MKSYDYIVVGGGVIGASLTYYLSRLDQKVLLLEKKDLCSGSAGATDGYITPHTKQPGYHLELALESCRIYETLPQELESDIDIELALHCGGIQACEDELQWRLISDNARAFAESGFHVEMLDIGELRKIEPALSPKLRGGLYSDAASSVNPFRLTQAFADAAKKFGAELRLGCGVDDLVSSGEQIVGVETAQGAFYADTVVNCCGSWGGALAKLAGLELPVVPRRGQIIVSEPVAPMLNTVMQTGIYPIIKYHPELITDERVFRLGLAWGMEQTRDGTLLIGGTRELVGFDRGTTLEGIEAVLKQAEVYVPSVRELRFIRSFSGFRPRTPDGLPILGRVASKPGFAMCCGHEGDGIALAPATGKLVAEELVRGRASFSLAPCYADRFLRGAERSGA